MDIKANWLWFETEQKEGVFARARKTFNLKRSPAEAELSITCSGQYRLYVNGKFLARGPAHSPPYSKIYDTHHVARLLRQGVNVIAVKLEHFGYYIAHSPPSPPGFLCQLVTPGAKVITDSTWRISHDEAYAVNGNRRNNLYGPIEIYDARREDDWLEAKYNDSAWPKAVIIRDKKARGGPLVSPWRELRPRSVPQGREQNFLPRSVVRQGEVEEKELHANWQLPYHLAKDRPLKARYTKIEGAAGLLHRGGKPAVVRQPSLYDQSKAELRSATILLDFGRESTGFLWFEVTGNEGAVIDIAYSERLMAGWAQPLIQDVGYADRYILKAGRQRHEVYDWKGFRYVQLTFRNLEGPLKLHDIGLNFTSYPVKERGSFSCSDSLMNKIWKVGAYTQQLCMHDRLMDCPWREQQQWLGDGRVQLLIIQNAFGDKALPRKFIDDFARSQMPDGTIPAVSFRGGGYIIDYSLWWVQAVKDVLLFDGDIENAASYIPNISKLFAWFEQYREKNGLLTDVPGWLFIDWANVGKDGSCAPLNAIYHIALDAAADIAELAGKKKRAQLWRGEAERVRAAYHRRFWHAKRKLYVDNAVKGKKSNGFSQHTQSITVLAGLCRVDEKALMKRAITDKRLVLTEPYFSFYLLEALARTDGAVAAMQIVRKKWGDMIAQGATSFWEEWQVEGTFRGGKWLARPRSHCHAWSAAPTAWLSRYVLGVRVEEAEGPILIEPNPCGLKHASGIVPTRFGAVKVSWKVKGKKLSVRVKTPNAAPLLFIEPAGFRGKTDFKRS